VRDTPSLVSKTSCVDRSPILPRVVSKKLCKPSSSPGDLQTHPRPTNNPVTTGLQHLRLELILERIAHFRGTTRKHVVMVLPEAMPLVRSEKEIPEHFA
jgi:hypothetical protein